MSRPLRLEFAGALYHLTARGDRREPIFEDDEDRVQLLDVLARGLERFEAECYAYCLMGNHYHFVVQTRRGNLSRLMRHLNGVYTQAYNRRHDTSGHLFQGRFKAVVVDRDAYFLELCRYVDLNPVRAKMVKRPQDWHWSSYRAHTGLVQPPAWLNSAELHRQIAPRAPARDGPAKYAAFVAQGRAVRLWEDALSRQIYLGDAGFVARMQAKLTAAPQRLASVDIPRAQRRRPPRPLEVYLAHARGRETGIALAYLQGGYTQTAIAAAAQLSVSRISRLVKSYEAKDKT